MRNNSFWYLCFHTTTVNSMHIFTINNFKTFYVLLFDFI